MKVSIRSVIVLLSALILTSSCLSTDDDNDITYYNDTAITAFTLGTLNKYYWTKTKYTDEDSLVKTTVTGSNYEMYIDQSQRKIYNNDSLPLGTDAAHVLCTVSSLNSGTVIIKYLSQEGEDSLAYYSSSDSLDFTEPVEFRVYANSGAAYRSYEVKVNVHTEDPDSFRWSNCATVDAFKSFADMRAASVNGKVILLGTDGASTTAYTTDSSDGATWTKAAEGLGADAYRNTAVLGGKLYAASNGSLLSTQDGASWTTVGTFTKSRLLGAGSKKLYAEGSDGTLAASADGGLTWTDEEMSDGAALLPTDNISMAALPLVTNDSTERIVMTGVRDMTASQADTAAVVWSKIEEYAGDSDTHPWVCYSTDGEYRLPAQANLTMIKYGSVLAALGGSPEGQAQSAGFTYLYISRDNGLTWLTGTKYVLPDDFTNAASDTFAMTADSDNILWIVCGGTGQVWRGRLNSLGWKTYKESFTE